MQSSNQVPEKTRASRCPCAAITRDSTGNKKEEVKVKLDEDQLKILDELPSSAVEMQVKDKQYSELSATSVTTCFNVTCPLRSSCVKTVLDMAGYRYFLLPMEHCSLMAIFSTTMTEVLIDK
ncbi:hypothetical protein J6590_041467 [Homalodisca vitripennis]|nr:hypothetical protein J6590_041467 [Homalodisca vitripennis]